MKAPTSGAAADPSTDVAPTGTTTPDPATGRAPVGERPTFGRPGGTAGHADGRFDDPTGAAVAPEGGVYMADTLNNRAQAFAADGTFAHAWGAYGAEPEQFANPRSVAVDASGGCLRGGHLQRPHPALHVAGDADGLLWSDRAAEERSAR